MAYFNVRCLMISSSPEKEPGMMLVAVAFRDIVTHKSASTSLRQSLEIAIQALVSDR
jgi:hypothetical protein